MADWLQALSDSMVGCSWSTVSVSASPVGTAASSGPGVPLGPFPALAALCPLLTLCPLAVARWCRCGTVACRRAVLEVSASAVTACVVAVPTFAMAAVMDVLGVLRMR